MNITSDRAERPAARASGDDAALVRRVCAEYAEMPGLSLTREQASRLFGIAPDRCARVLSRLVDAGDLCLTNTGQHVRPTGGR